MLILKSVNSDVELEFSAAQEDGFQVEVRARDHGGTISVYSYTDPRGVVTLFAEAAQEWRGWVGKKSWESLEGEFRIAMKSDSLGHIFTRVMLRSNPGGADEWELNAELTLEAGQLESIAKRVKQVWSAAS